MHAKGLQYTGEVTPLDERLRDGGVKGKLSLFTPLPVKSAIERLHVLGEGSADSEATSPTASAALMS